jgi:hypothetical protein
MRLRGDDERVSSLAPVVESDANGADETPSPVVAEPGDE